MMDSIYPTLTQIMDFSCAPFNIAFLHYKGLEEVSEYAGMRHIVKGARDVTCLTTCAIVMDDGATFLLSFPWETTEMPIWCVRNLYFVQSMFVQCR